VENQKKFTSKHNFRAKKRGKNNKSKELERIMSNTGKENSPP
jgi:hypothetical protein